MRRVDMIEGISKSAYEEFELFGSPFLNNKWQSYGLTGNMEMDKTEIL
jgi:hypothetical protein